MVEDRHDVYCALCGVPLGIHPDVYMDRDVGPADVDWTWEYVAIYESMDPNEKGQWLLSGIDEISGVPDVVPPVDFDVRQDVQKVIDESSWQPCSVYTPSSDGEVTIYPMHLTCRNVLFQQFASLSTTDDFDIDKVGTLFARQPREPKNRGLTPEWCGDYWGPEKLWEQIGWSNNDRTEFHNDDLIEATAIISDNYDLYFLACDPDSTEGLSHRLPVDDQWAGRETHIKGRLPSDDSTYDLFETLPEEILQEIFSFLPVTAVTRARLASRRLASLSLGTSFWHSRFQYPNEFSHVMLPDPKTDGSQATAESVLAWRTILKGPWWSDEDDNLRGLKNRRRITKLCNALYRKLQEEPEAPVGPAKDPQTFITDYFRARGEA